MSTEVWVVGAHGRADPHDCSVWEPLCGPGGLRESVEAGTAGSFDKVAGGMRACANIDLSIAIVDSNADKAFKDSTMFVELVGGCE